MRRLLVVVVCAMAGVAAAAQTQTSDPVQGPTFRTGVDVISVDVGVVDSRGRPIEDLHAADFTVKIDGEARRVVSAELVKVDLEKAKAKVADKTESFFTTNLTPPEGRQIVLAIDQVQIRPGAIPAVLQAAAKFLDKLSPLDQVAFITYPEPGPRVGFTNDHYKLKLAMQKLIGHESATMATLFNIGLTEAIAISERRDAVVLADVMMRECHKAVRQDDCEREVVDESSAQVVRMRQEADQSLRGLEYLLLQLAYTDGPKSLILISDGLATDRLNEFDEIARRAARARVSMNVLLLDGPGRDITIAQDSPTAREDRRMAVTGLEELAAAGRGSLFHVTGTGEPIFDRLASELSAYYLLGVEQHQGDLEGDKRRIDVQVRRKDATIRSRQAFVLSAPSKTKRSTNDVLRDALASPFAISGVPLRITTFAQQDPAGGKVRLVIAADVGEAGAQTAPFTVGYLLADTSDGRVASSFGGVRTLTSGGNGAPLEYVTGALVDPGIYELRLAVVDADGRRGSVVREVNAWKMAGETLATGDLFVGNMPTPGQAGIRPAVEPHVSADTLAAYVELYSTTAATFDGAAVTFEVADDADTPALVAAPARFGAGPQPSWRTADAGLSTRALPAGRYVARARLVRGSSTVTVLSRPFVLERTTPVVAAFAPSIAAFDRGPLLQPAFLSAMFDLAEKRAPTLKSAIADARAGKYGPAALDALSSGDQVTAAFIRGIELFGKGDLNGAATQLQMAAGPRREFFPAAVYLGACFAAAGRDRDAAGVWQIALGTEPRPPEVYAMAADARMRDGTLDAAIEILRIGYERVRDEQLGRRLAVAYAVNGRYAEALPLLDAHLLRQPADQDALFGAIVGQYELVRTGQVLSNVDRAKVKRYAEAYNGPQKNLVAKYVEAMGVK
jgi:VWFA-related protein